MGYRQTLVLALGLSVGLAALAAAPFEGSGFDVHPWDAKARVPTLQGTDLNGKEWRLSNLRGKVVLINFWASWCEPCRAEMPSLQALAQRYPEQVVVLAVNLKESSNTVQNFAERTALQLPVLRDVNGVMARSWRIRIYPSTVLVAPDGRVVSVVRGALDWAGADGAKLLTPLLQK